ncbi:MAG: DNA polymerase III subunit epsilon [Pseudomonadota bacterium]|nr:DNA polymerase III subunit epsilon [Pseudomonadota bacterium]
MRLIVLDTETTGLNVEDGHKIIEIGCVEIIDRNITENVFHEYICPNRKIDEDAIKIHGITNEFLKDKPIFSKIKDRFFSYLQDSDLIIHNAPFDIGFLKKEIADSDDNPDSIDEKRKIHDTLKMARNSHPGKRNSLDALCDRYAIDRESRKQHGALLDAHLLANVYLKMTVGQTSLSGLTEVREEMKINETKLIDNRKQRVIYANEEELKDHQNFFTKPS